MKNCDTCKNTAICKYIGSFMNATAKAEKLNEEVKDSQTYEGTPIEIAVNASCSAHREETSLEEFIEALERVTNGSVCNDIKVV